MTRSTHHARRQRIRSLQYHEVQLLLRHIAIMLQGLHFCQPSASPTKPIAKHKQITALAFHYEIVTNCPMPGTPSTTTYTTYGPGGATLWLGGEVTNSVCFAFSATQPLTSNSSIRWPICTEWVTKPPWYRTTLTDCAPAGAVNETVNSPLFGAIVFVGMTMSVGLLFALSPCRYGGT